MFPPTLLRDNKLHTIGLSLPMMVGRRCTPLVSVRTPETVEANGARVVEMEFNIPSDSSTFKNTAASNQGRSRLGHVRSSMPECSGKCSIESPLTVNNGCLSEARMFPVLAMVIDSSR